MWVDIINFMQKLEKKFKLKPDSSFERTKKAFEFLSGNKRERRI